MGGGGQDHYGRLGVDSDASPDELRRAYRRLAARLHPDVNPGDVAGATRRMVELNEAYETLSDPVRRFDYDRSRRRQQPSPPPVRKASSPTADARRTPTADDPVRRARREAKERAAAEAARRGYRDPNAGRMDFRAPG